MFLHVSVISVHRGVCPIACWDIHPPSQDQRQVPHPGPGTPLREQTRPGPGTPQSRYPLGPGRHPLRPDTPPPGSRHLRDQAPPQSRHPLGLGRHPRDQAHHRSRPPQCMLGYGQQAGGTHPTGMQSRYYYKIAMENEKQLHFYQFCVYPWSHSAIHHIDLSPTKLWESNIFGHVCLSVSLSTGAGPM